MFFRYRRCVNHQVNLLRNQINILYIMNSDTICFQFFCQYGFSFIVPTYFYTACIKKPGDCTHSNSTDTNKIHFIHLVNPPERGIHKDSISLYVHIISISKLHLQFFHPHPLFLMAQYFFLALLVLLHPLIIQLP